MVEAEVDKRILPSTQVEFRYMEAGGSDSRYKGGGGRVCVDRVSTGFIFTRQTGATKNKDWEASVDCLERAMGSSWWEWSVGSR